MTDKTICRNDGRCEYAIQTGAEGNGHCPAGACAMPCDNSAAHLTIPGALEWDGDNGTHGVVGTHSADGESSADHSGDTNEKVEPAAYVLHRNGAIDWDQEVIISNTGGDEPDERFKWVPVYAAPVSAYTAVDMTTAAAGGFRDGQTAATDELAGLRAKLAERDALLNTLLTSYRDIAREPTPGWVCAGTVVRDIRRGIESLSIIAKPVAPKTCIECDQPYCHGVCVERGDQDYDRDQAAKGGEQ